MANKPQVQVNGTTSGYDPSVQSQITTALLQNGGIKRIQDTLQQRLDEAGWSQALREYVLRLFRSGEATTYDDAMTKVMQQIKAGGGTSNGTNGSVAAADLSIPQTAREGGAEVIKRELEGICVMGGK